MKILLVNPPYVESVYTGLKNAVTVEVPLGIAYLAAVLEKGKIPVSVLDANVLELSIEETVKRIVSSDADVVGFTATTSSISTVFNIAKLVKEKSNKKILVGGVHITADTERTMKECPQIDIGVIGEAEYTLLELMQKEFKNLSEIKGIVFRKNGEIIVNPRRPRIENLDELPFPARHLFPLKLYRPGAIFNIGIPKGRTATIMTSRGCPNKCSYCASVHFWGTDVKFRSAKNIVEEIEHLIKNYNTKQIGFLDDTFTANARRIDEFCDLLLEKKIKIKWWCYARVNTVTERLMVKMKKAGCYGFSFGIESGVEEILRGVNKNTNPKQNERTVKLALKHDFMVHTSLMIGLPGDTKETVMKTVEFAKKLNNHISFFCITTPFPGTKLYDDALKKGLLSDIKSWNDIGLHQKTKYRTESLTSEEIFKLYKYASRKFYFRFGFFWTLFKRLIRHPKEFKGFLLAGLYMMME